MSSLESHLRFLRQMDIKPNYSELSREYKMDRHTIKKRMESLDDPSRERRPRPSALDPLAAEIGETLSQKGVTLRAAYWYFKNERGVKCSYSNFKHYARKRGLGSPCPDATPHPLYETDPGKVLQCDWVESMQLTLSNGEKVAFNLFSATLGYSRLHYFELAETRTEGTFKRCLCHCLRFLGGRPKEVLTDNMSALVSIQGGRRKVHPSVHQFASGIGVKIRFCKVRTPQTKGKDECSNKFAKWLLAYEGRLGTADDLSALVARLVRDINRERNSALGIPPCIEFAKEKEHLLPLPSEAVMREYESWSHSCTVPQTQLISFHGSRYSVPPKYISKTVEVEEDSGMVYIYHGGHVIATHEASDGTNYSREHLREGISASIGGSAEIDSYIETTLGRFKEVS